MVRARLLLVPIALLALASAVVVPVARAAEGQGASVPTPKVEGPISGGTFGHAFGSAFFDLAPYGYTEKEFFFSGAAKSYSIDGDDKPYKTRMLAIAPIDPKRFNGTVIVEWLNVTSSYDLAVEWLQVHPVVMREGYAYVQVSAQSAGVSKLQRWDAARYGSLTHPADNYAYDIFSQAIKALRAPATPSPLGSLRPNRVLAVGNSQSGIYLDMYIENDVDAAARIIDGFLIAGDLGRSPGGPNYGQKMQLRTTDVPLIKLETEESAQPEDTSSGPKFRLWQVAGASHVDHWLKSFWDAQKARDDNHTPPVKGGSESLAARAGTYGESDVQTGAVCLAEGNTFPRRFAARAALTQLDRWVRTGQPANVEPLIEFSAPAWATGPTIARDSYGNTKGGMRYPPVDVPVATYIATTCFLYGQTLPMAPGALGDLYPSHVDYVAKMRAATDAAVKSGILLPIDARELMSRANAAPVPR